MRFVVAIDSFKGSLSSMQAGRAVKEGILRADPTAEVAVRPLADGGEGTVEALCAGLGGEMVEVEVKGPRLKPVIARYALIGKDTAVMEMSAAAGITLLSEEEKDPMEATTVGVGEMIKDAVLRGCRRFIIGIGGSATNDGGIGMLSALGYRFLDKNGEEVPFGAKGLGSLSSISADGALSELKDCTFKIACDVTNPLCGELGCSAVYGHQKGATPETIAKMDRWLKDYATLAKSLFPDSDEDFPGCGAAGGLGFAFKTFLSAELRPGIDIVLDETKLEEAVASADVVVTGEGRLDAQTAMGKAPIGVAKLAKKHGKKTVAFSGCVTDDARKLNSCGIDAFFPILREITTLDAALDVEIAYKNLADTSEQVFRLAFLFLR